MTTTALKKPPLFVRLDKWLMDHCDKEDYLTIYDFVTNCNSDQLADIIQVCHLRIQDLKAVTKLAKKNLSSMQEA